MNFETITKVLKVGTKIYSSEMLQTLIRSLANGNQMVINDIDIQE